MALPPQLDAARRQAIGIVTALLALIEQQRRISRQPPEVFSSSMVSLGAAQQTLERIGAEPHPFQHITPTPGVDRSDVRQREEEERGTASTEKAAMVQILQNAIKASSDVITNQKEEEADIVKAISMLDGMLQALQNKVVGAEYNHYHSTVEMILKDDLLGPLTKRQEDLLRVTENIEEQLINNPSYSRHLFAEHVRMLGEVRDRITRRARGFLDRRLKAYQGFLRVFSKVPRSPQIGSQADLQKAYAAIAKVRKGLEIIQHDSIETGRMFRMEHARFKELADSLAA